MTQEQRDHAIAALEAAVTAFTEDSRRASQDAADLRRILDRVEEQSKASLRHAIAAKEAAIALRRTP